MRINDVLAEAGIRPLCVDTVYSVSDLRHIADVLKPSYIRHRGKESEVDAKQTAAQPYDTRIPCSCNSIPDLDMYFEKGPFAHEVLQFHCDGTNYRLLRDPLE